MLYDEVITSLKSFANCGLDVSDLQIELESGILHAQSTCSQRKSGSYNLQPVEILFNEPEKYICFKCLSGEDERGYLSDAVFPTSRNGRRVTLKDFIKEMRFYLSGINPDKRCENGTFEENVKLLEALELCPANNYVSAKLAKKYIHDAGFSEHKDVEDQVLTHLSKLEPSMLTKYLQSYTQTETDPLGLKTDLLYQSAERSGKLPQLLSFLDELKSETEKSTHHVLFPVSSYGFGLGRYYYNKRYEDSAPYPSFLGDLLERFIVGTQIEGRFYSAPVCLQKLLEELGYIKNDQFLIIDEPLNESDHKTIVFMMGKLKRTGDPFVDLQKAYQSAKALKN